MGKYQMGGMALADAGFYNGILLSDGSYMVDKNNYGGTWTELAKKYGVTSKETFLGNQDAQEIAIIEFHKQIWKYIEFYKLDQFIGTEIHGIKVTSSGLIAGMHLVGTRGILHLFGLKYYSELSVNSEGIPIDGNKTPATKYLLDMGGIDITGLIGKNPDKKDILSN